MTFLWMAQHLYHHKCYWLLKYQCVLCRNQTVIFNRINVRVCHWPYVPHAFMALGLAISINTQIQTGRANVFWVHSLIRSLSSTILIDQSYFNWPLSNKAPLVENPCRSVYIAHKWRPMGCFLPHRTLLYVRYSLICMGLPPGALIWKVVNSRC